MPAPPTTSASPLASTAALCLKLSNGRQAGRVIRLTALRCTVGSAPQCTLRLKAPGIEPLHCFIDRTGLLPVVRRLAGQSWVNDQPLNQAMLQPGSRLRLAGIEFEVVADELAPLQPPQQQSEQSQSLAEEAQPAFADQPPVADLPQEPAPAKGSQGNAADGALALREAFERRLELVQEQLAQLGRDLTRQSEEQQQWQSRVVEAAELDAIESRLSEKTEKLLEQAVDAAAARITPELYASLSTELSTLVESQLADSARQWSDQVSSDVVPKVVTTVTADVLTWLEAELTAASERLGAEISTQIAPRLTRDAAEAAADQLRNELGQQLTDTVVQHVNRAAEELAAALPERLAPEVAEQACQRVADEVQRELTEKLDQVSKELHERLTSQLTEELSARIASEVANLESLARGQSTLELDPALVDRLTAEVTDRTVQHLVPLVAERATAEASTAIQQHVTEAVLPYLAQYAADQLSASAASQVDQTLTQQLMPEVENRLASFHAELAEQWNQYAQQLEQQALSQQAAAPADSGFRDLEDQVRHVVLENLNGLAEQLAGDVTLEVGRRLDQQITDKVAAQVAAEQAAFESQRNEWEQQQHKAQEQLNLHAQHLEQRLEALMRFQRGLDEQHQQWQKWEHDLHAMRPELLGRAEHVEQTVAELRRQHEAWAAQYEQWKSEIQARQEQTDGQFDELRRQLEALANRWEAFETEQRDRLNEAGAASQERCEQIDHRLAEIRAEREAFEQERLAHHDRNKLHPGEHARLLDERLAEIHAAGQAHRQRNQHWEEEGGVAEVPEEGEAAERDAGRFETHEEQANAEEPVAYDAPEADGLQHATEPNPEDEPADRYTQPLQEIKREEAAEHVDAPEAENNSPEAEEEGAPVHDSAAPPVEPSKMFAHLLRDDDEEEEAQPSHGGLGGPSAREAASSSEPPASGSGGNSEEDSIETYMARLMERVRGMQGSSTAASPPPTNEHESTPRRREEPTPATPAPAPPPELPKVKDLSELGPRATPPELTSNISAMRDLANLTARSAIDAHSRRRMRSMVYGKLLVCFVALAAAGILTWMSARAGQLAYGAALVSTIIAVIWGVEYLVLAGYHFWRSKKPAPSLQPPAQPADVARQ